MEPLSPASRRAATCLAIVVTVTAALLLLATSPSLPLTWDEGSSFSRADALYDLGQRLLTAGDIRQAADLLSARSLSQRYPYTIYHEGHPSFSGWLIALGRAIAPADWEPKTAYRLGPMLWFALAAGALAYRLARDHSTIAAVAGVAALLAIPRAFVHAHIAAFDGPLTASWILAWCCYGPARRDLRIGGVLFGLFLGLTFGCKATGWLAPVPFLACALLQRDRRGLLALAVGVPIALAVFVWTNPPLWHDPIGGLQTFFELNANRAARPGLNISTQFLGRMYNLDYSPPWYNAFFWTAVTVPVGTLLLAAVGMASVLRRGITDNAGPVILANWLVLLIVRALPGVPPHDGIRLFLPSFPFLACLAGIGLAQCWTFIAGRRWPRSAQWLARLAAALLLVGSASSVAWYWPQGLSHYNLLIGGLRGATRAGMEPTYYWDSLDRRALRWLNEHTPPHVVIRFGSAPPQNLRLLRRCGMLEPLYLPDPGSFPLEPPASWYVIQCRPSAHHAHDRWLIQNAQPVYQHTIRPPDEGYGPWRLDVPILEVYAYADYERAVAATTQQEVEIDRNGP